MRHVFVLMKSRVTQSGASTDFLAKYEERKDDTNFAFTFDPVIAIRMCCRFIKTFPHHPHQQGDRGASGMFD